VSDSGRCTARLTAEIEALRGQLAVAADEAAALRSGQQRDEALFE